MSQLPVSEEIATAILRPTFTEPFDAASDWLQLSMVGPPMPRPTFIEVPQPRAVPFPELSGYTVLRELGHGGMGIVYLARDVRLKRLVAIKMLREGPTDAESGGRFRTEAEAVAKLHHPNIVQIYEIGDYFGRPFLVLEFIDGPSLHQLLNGKPLPHRRAAELLEPLAQAMQHAHDHGIMHRDVKPGNILLSVARRSSFAENDGAAHSSSDRPGTTDDGQQPKITDFGLAKSLESDSRLTQSGNVVGTPNYMAPEQTDGQCAVGPPADIYGLGATLYELLTGRPPFNAASGIETLYQVRFLEPISPRQLQPSVPRDLETICLKCLQKEPTKRYASAAALAVDLRHYLDGRPILSRPISGPAKLVRWGKRNPLVASLVYALAATVVVLAVGSGQLIVANRHERQARAEADRYLTQARGDADEVLATIAADRALKRPDLVEVRKRLLLKAITAYERLADVQGGTAEFEAQRGRVLARLGEARRELGETREALRQLEQARDVFANLMASLPSEPRYRRELATCYRHLGGLYGELGANEPAEAAFAHALTLYGQLRQDSPTADEYRAGLTQTYAARHRFFLMTSRPDVAQADYAAALQECEAGAAQDVDSRRSRASLRSALASLLPRFEDARPLFEQALADCRDLHQQFPADPEGRFDLARTCNQVAFALERSQGSARQIEELLDEELQLLEGLVADCPAIPEYRTTLALCHASLSAHYYHSPRWVQGAPHLRRALDIQQKLVADYPAMLTYAEDLGGTQGSFARAKLDFGRLSESLPLFERCIATLEGVLARDPSRATGRLYLTNILNDRAVTFLRLNRPADAVEDFTRILELGIRADMWEIHFARAEALALAGRYAEAADEAEAIPPDLPLDGDGVARPRGLLDLLARLHRISDVWPAKPPLPSGLREQHMKGTLDLLRWAGSAGRLRDPALRRQLRERDDLAPLRQQPEFAEVVRRAVVQEK